MEVSEMSMYEIRLSSAAGEMLRATFARNDEIRTAYRDGVPVPVIAEAVGMTRQAVYKILKGGGQDAR